MARKKVQARPSKSENTNDSSSGAKERRAGCLAGSVFNIVIQHFGAHQKKVIEDDGKSNLSVSRRQKLASVRYGSLESRAQLLFHDLDKLRPSTQDENCTPLVRSCANDEDYCTQIVESVLHCVDLAVSSMAESGKSSNETTLASNSILELAAALGVTYLSNSQRELGLGSGFLIKALFDRAGLATCASNEWVRIAGCLLFGICLKEITKFCYDNAWLADDQGEHSSATEWIKNLLLCAAASLVPRCTDKSQAVRNMAIQVSRYSFIAEPLKPNSDTNEKQVLPSPESYFFYSDELETSLGVALTHESSAANRMVAARSLPLHEDTIPLLVDRVRDVKVKVRTEALAVFKENVPLSALTLQDKLEILSSGLTDRCADTQRSTMTLLCCNWLKSVKFHPTALIETLDPISNEELCEKTIRLLEKAITVESKIVMKELSANEVKELRNNMDLPLEKDISSIILSPVTAIYIRVRASQLVQRSDTASMELMSKVVPDSVALSTCLQKHLAEYLNSVERLVDIRSGERQRTEQEIEKEEKLQETESFVCSQLLNLAQVSHNAQGDEAGRRQISCLIKNILCSSDGDDELVEPSVTTLKAFSADEHEFIRTISEIIGEISKGYDSSQPSDSSNEMSARYIRCMMILSVAFENTMIPIDNEPGSSEFLSLILNCLTNPMKMVRQAASSCLGRYGIICRNFSTIKSDIRPILWRITENVPENVEVRAQALLGISDLQILFPDDESSNTLSKFMIEHLSPGNNGMKIIVAECCVRCLLAKAISDKKLLALLLLYFFELDGSILPSTDKIVDVTEIGSPERLQQVLSIFFPAYCMGSFENRQMLLSCIKDLLILSTSRSSPKHLQKLPFAKICDYTWSTVALSEQAQAVAVSKKEDKHANDVTPQITPSSSLVHMLCFLKNIIEVLIEKSHEMTVTTMRSISNKLGSFSVNLRAQLQNLKDENPQLLDQISNLKSSLEELEGIIDDHYAERSIEALLLVLCSFRPPTTATSKEADKNKGVIETHSDDNSDDDEESEQSC